MKRVLSIQDESLFERYLSELAPLDPLRLWQSFVHFKNLPTLKFSASASAVYSSQIEGNTLELEAFLELEAGAPSWWQAGEAERRMVEDLRDAYEFARSHVLSEKNFLKAHAMLARREPRLRKEDKGAYRTGTVRVVSSHGVVYTGPEATRVQAEMQRLFEEIAALRTKRLSVRKSFYHATLAHFLFEKIHPFADGNGRAGRLLEKWFLASVRGSRAWKVPTEEYYRLNLGRYYAALDVGPSYDAVEMRKVLPFLSLPVEALQLGRDRAARNRKAS